jgi:hypothetical protein
VTMAAPPLPPPVVLPTLIREIEKRGRAQGLSVAGIAEALGVDRTRFIHIRSGSGRLSLASVHEIASRFLDDSTVRELLLGYLAFDIEGRRGAPRGRSLLDEAARETASTLLRNLPSLLVSSSGILLLDPRPARLASVLALIEETARDRGVSVLRERAAAGLSLDRRRALLAAPLVIVDGVASLREPVGDVLRRRSEAARLTLATWHAHSGETPPPPFDTYRHLRLPPIARATH